MRQVICRTKLRATGSLSSDSLTTCSSETLDQVQKGNLGEKSVCLANVDRKKVERINCENNKSFMVIFVNFPIYLG